MTWNDSGDDCGDTRLFHFGVQCGNRSIDKFVEFSDLTIDFSNNLQLTLSGSGLEVPYQTS